jgi:hypothetical protein
MNTISLVVVVALLVIGLFFFYGKALIAAFKVTDLALESETISIKRAQTIVIQLAIYLMLGGTCLALIVFLIFGGDALSLGGIVDPNVKTTNLKK